MKNETAIVNTLTYLSYTKTDLESAVMYAGQIKDPELMKKLLALNSSIGEVKEYLKSKTGHVTG